MSEAIKNPKIFCTTPAQLEARAKIRPAGYLADLEPCVVSRDENRVCMDSSHPAYVAAVIKYRVKGSHVFVDKRVILTLAACDDMVELFPSLLPLRDAPAGCLDCGGDPKHIWSPKLHAVKLEIVRAPPEHITALKARLKIDKLSLLCETATDGGKQMKQFDF